jgi:hypothetical protein
VILTSSSTKQCYAAQDVNTRGALRDASKPSIYIAGGRLVIVRAKPATRSAGAVTAGVELDIRQGYEARLVSSAYLVSVA